MFLGEAAILRVAKLERNPSGILCHNSAMQDSSALERLCVADDDSVFAENQKHFPNFSESHLYSQGLGHQISNLCLEQCSIFSSNSKDHSEDGARYSDVWFLLSLLDGPNKPESVTDSPSPSDKCLTLHSSLPQCARSTKKCNYSKIADALKFLH